MKSQTVLLRSQGTQEVIGTLVAWKKQRATFWQLIQKLWTMISLLLIVISPKEKYKPTLPHIFSPQLSIPSLPSLPLPSSISSIISLLSLPSNSHMTFVFNLFSFLSYFTIVTRDRTRTFGGHFSRTKCSEWQDHL